MSRDAFKTGLFLCLCIVLDLSAQPVLLWEATFDDCSGATGVVRSSDVLIVAGNHMESGMACLIGLSEEGDVLWKNEVAPPDSFTSITITSLALSPVGAVAAGWVEDATGSTAGYATEITRDGKALWWRTYRHKGRGVLIRAIRLDYTGYTLVGRLRDTGEGFMAGLRYDGTYFWSRTVTESGRDVDLLDAYVQRYSGRFVAGMRTGAADADLFIDRVGWKGEIDRSYPLSTVKTVSEMVDIVPGDAERVFVVHGGMDEARIFSVSTETGDVGWDRTYAAEGDSDTKRVTSAGPARKGGFYLAGYLQASGEQDAVIARFDSSGTAEWEFVDGDSGADERFDDVLGSRDGRVVAVGSRGSCTDRHCGTLRIVALQEDVDFESYYPLAIGNTWTYGTAWYKSDGTIDSLSTGPLDIEETIIMNDTLYYVAPHPFGYDDTLRTDQRGRIWSRWRGRDRLWYDFSRLDGEAFFKGRIGSGFEDWEDPHFYGRFTPVSLVHADQVETYAGIFHDAVLVYADQPPVADDEEAISFVAGVGIVRAASAWSHLWLLSHATVDGRSIPSHVEPPILEEPAASVFPNPARERITIQVGESQQRQPVTITLIDVLGRQVGGVTRCAAECTLHRETDGLSSGTYFVRIEGARGVDVVPVVVWK